MKNYLRRSTIKSKIILITLGTSTLVVLLVLFTVIANQVFRYRQDLQKNLAIVADMVAFSSSVPLMFKDSKGASAALSPLSTNPTILNGHIFTDEGLVFASYQNSAIPDECRILKEINASGTVQQRLALLEGLGTSSFWRIGSSFDMVRPILSDGKNIGFVVLHSSTAPLRELFIRVASFSAVILISAL